MMVKDTQSLRLSLSNQEISEETSLQVIDINGQVFGFVGVLVALPASAVLLVAMRRLQAGYMTSKLYTG